MKYNTLGHTGLLVSELCLGTMTFAAGEGMWKPIAGVDQKLADELLSSPSTQASTSSIPRMFTPTANRKRSLAQAIANLGIAA